MISHRQLELLTEICRWDTGFHTSQAAGQAFPHSRRKAPSSEQPRRGLYLQDQLEQSSELSLCQEPLSLQQMVTGSLHSAVISSFYLPLENPFNLNPVSILCFTVSCFDQFWNEKASCHTHCFDLKSVFEMSMVVWKGVCGRNKWCLLPLVGG